MGRSDQAISYQLYDIIVGLNEALLLFLGAWLDGGHSEERNEGSQPVSVQGQAPIAPLLFLHLSKL